MPSALNLVRTPAALSRTNPSSEPRESCSSCDPCPRTLLPAETGMIQGTEAIVAAPTPLDSRSHCHLLSASGPDNSPGTPELPQGPSPLQIHFADELQGDSPDTNVPLPPILSSAALHAALLHTGDEMIFHDNHADHLDIVLSADPLVFRGVGQNYESTVLSGDVILHLPDATNIREINLNFCGKARIPSSDIRQPHVRGHLHTHTLITHDWSFLEGAKNHRHTLKAGRHVFPFSLQLDGSLPATTITTIAAITYKLKATVIRSAFTSNWVAQKPVTIVRTFAPEALEYNQTLEIENTWPGKIMYSIILPHKAFAAGDQIPLLFKFSPLAKGVSVLSIETSIKEYVTVRWKHCPTYQDTRTVTTCTHIIRNGRAISAAAAAGSSYYDQAQQLPSSLGPLARGSRPPSISADLSREGPSGSAIARVAAMGSAVLLAPGLVREDCNGENNLPQSDNSTETLMGEQDIDTSIKVPIPITAIPTHTNDPIMVLQKIKWSIILSNLDGHTSELRCALPIHILSHSVLEDARLATHETRALLFGTEEPSVAPPTTLPSYASHVHDRVANAIDGIDGLATLGPNPLHSLDLNAPSSTSATPSVWSPGSSPTGPAGYFPAHGNSSSWNSTPQHTLASSGGDLHTLGRVDSGLLLSLGDSINQALPTPLSRTNSPPDHHGHSSRQSRANSRANSRASSRAPSPERGAASSDSHSTGLLTTASTPGSTSSTSGHSIFGSASSRLSLALKPFSLLSSKHQSASKAGSSSPSSQQVSLPQPNHPMSFHALSPPSSRPPSRTPSRQNMRAEFNLGNQDHDDHQSMSLDSQMMLELLSRVPDYRRASRGFLGGGVTPLESSIGLPTYDEVDRMPRVQSDGSIYEYGRQHRRSGDHSILGMYGLSTGTRPPTPVSEEPSDADEGITMRTRPSAAPAIS